MKTIRNTLLLIAILTFSFKVNATIFEIQNIRIGPNPIIKQRDGMQVNYVSTLPHTSSHYLFSVTGELVLQKHFGLNIPNITNAGECQFELFQAHELATLPSQLYIMILKTTSLNETKTNRKYVIIK